MIAKKIPMRKANLSSFEGLVTYLAGSQGVANRVGKVEIHNYESSDLRWAVQETLAVQDQNKRSAADKTYHLMVSLAGGEFLTDEQLSRIEQSMIEALGYAEHQRISVVHRDTDNLHFHVAINKVHPEKKTIHEPYNDFKILGRECRKFEEEYGLQRVQRGGRGNKKIDMEEVAGIESLIGWIRRECGEQIKEAKTWEQLYHVLSDHGLEIKLRGNGFVISDGEHHVKASSVDREFSKSALEKRLGAFDQKTGVKAKPSKTYREKPLSKANVDDLFRQYKEEKELQKSRRQDFFLHLAQNRDMEIGRIKEKYAFRRSLIRHSSSGIARRILYRMLFRQMKDEIRSVRTDYARRRAVFFEQNKGFAWADWLKHRAAEGDVRVLDALRRRGKDAGYKGNRFVGKESGGFAGIKVDTVTKKGTVIYAEDGMTIRDTGSVLKLAAIPDDKAVSRALEIAIGRYGKVLTIGGTRHFQDKVARIAAAKGLDVSFTDGRLNHLYQQYVKEYEYVRERTDRYRQADGTGRADGRAGQQRGGAGYAGGKPRRYRWHGYDASRNRGFHAGISGYPIPKLSDSGGIGAGRGQSASAGSDSLRGMPERSLVRIQGRTQVLLPRDVSSHLEQQGSANYQAVRRTIHRTGGVAEIRQMQAVVGLVAKPGKKPPGFRRGSLRGMEGLAEIKISSAAVVEIPKNPEPAQENERLTHSLAPIDKYIAERQEKIDKKFDILNHRKYNPSDSGVMLFRGIRNIDGQALALFQPKEVEEILVMSVTPYVSRRLSSVKLGSEVKVTPTGQIRPVKGRHR